MFLEVPIFFYRLAQTPPPPLLTVQDFDPGAPLLVAKGFSQVEGLDYNEIFSPVVRFESVRLLFALAALENWHMTALDVKTAFLYGQLDEEIYKGQELKVLRLRRAIYGLKQASLAC